MPGGGIYFSYKISDTLKLFKIFCNSNHLFFGYLTEDLVFSLSKKPWLCQQFGAGCWNYALNEVLAWYNYNNETILFVEYLCSLDRYSNGIIKLQKNSEAKAFFSSGNVLSF